MLICDSIVEINVAIQVACMPACASCLPYLYTRIRSFVETRSSDTKNAKYPPTPKIPKISAFQKPNSPQKSTNWALRDWPGKSSESTRNPTITRQFDQADSSGSLPIVEGEVAYMEDKPWRKESTSESEGDQRPMRQDDLV